MTERWDTAKLVEGLRGKFQKPAAEKSTGSTLAERKLAEGGKVDGRTLRKTGRTELFSARLRKETKDAVHAYAREHDLLVAEVIEHAFAALLDSKKREG